MPLDPLLKAFLDQLAAQAAQAAPQELSPENQRATLAALLAAIGPNGIPIGKVVNLVCPGPGGDIALRSYSPIAASAETLPTLVYYHGGGFVTGDLDTHDGLCRVLANEAGVRVIAVDYRLAPEHKFPAAVEDAFAALTFIEANASVLGVDANRLAVGGDSAGGALAAIVCQMAKEKGAPHIAFQMLWFPVTHIGGETDSMRRNATGYLLERAWLEWCIAQYLPASADKNDPRLSPLLAPSFAGLPPAYVVTAGFDPLHDEGVAYAEKLRTAGIDVHHVDYPDMVHVFTYLYAVLPQAPQALKDGAAALKAALTVE